MDDFTFDDSYKALFFSLVVYVVCLVLRRVSELFLPQLRGEVMTVAKIWRSFVLPVLPVLVGATAGLFIDSFPYPEMLTSKATHVMYGLLCGFSAGWSYRIIKLIVASKWGVDLPGAPDDNTGVLLEQLPTDSIRKALAPKDK